MIEHYGFLPLNCNGVCLDHVYQEAAGGKSIVDKGGRIFSRLVWVQLCVEMELAKAALPPQFREELITPRFFLQQLFKELLGNSEVSPDRLKRFTKYWNLYKDAGGLKGGGRQAVLFWKRKRPSKVKKSRVQRSITPPTNIIAPKKNILVFGLSYPLIDKGELKSARQDALDRALDQEEMDSIQAAMDSGDPLQNMIDATKYGCLEEIDGRDGARAVATEQVCNANVIAISQQNSAKYHPTKHINGNFNDSRKILPAILESLKDSNPENQKLLQATLDYFWIPSGWDDDHWKPTFYSETITNLAKQNTLADNATVYLPFCLNIFREVVLAQRDIMQYYNIRFVRKSDSKEELSKIALWKGTQQIDEVTCQTILGKGRGQEEQYCRFSLQTIRQNLSETIPKEPIMAVARKLEDFYLIRFIALDVLPSSEWPPAPAPGRGRGRKKWEPKGQILGLVDPKKVKRGIMDKDPSLKPSLRGLTK